MDAKRTPSAFQLRGASGRKYKLLLSCCCTAGDLLNLFPILSFADDASSGKDSQVPEGSNGEYEDHSGKQWGKEQRTFFGFRRFLVQCSSHSVAEGKAEPLK